MALNQVYDEADQIKVPVAEGIKSGDPLFLEGDANIPAVALTDRGSDGEATVEMRGGFRFSVSSKKGEEAKTTKIGDKLYLDAATKKISKDTGKTLFGYALGAIGSGESAEIVVKLATP